MLMQFIVLCFIQMKQINSPANGLKKPQNRQKKQTKFLFYCIVWSRPWPLFNKTHNETAFCSWWTCHYNYCICHRKSTDQACCIGWSGFARRRLNLTMTIGHHLFFRTHPLLPKCFCIATTYTFIYVQVWLF